MIDLWACVMWQLFFWHLHKYMAHWSHHSSWESLEEKGVANQHKQDYKNEGESSYLICPLTSKVVWALQMISQPVSSIFPCSPLPSGTWRTPGLSISWCWLPTSSCVCRVSFPLSLCLARWFWQDLMNGRHDNTTAVCVSLLWSGGLRVVRLPAGSWHGLPRW